MTERLDIPLELTFKIDFSWLELQSLAEESFGDPWHYFTVILITPPFESVLVVRGRSLQLE